MGQRIKSIRQNVGNNQYGTPIPLGADGKNVDMESGLNLEELVIIGGNTRCLINEENGITAVSTTYFNKDGSVLKVKTDRIYDDLQGNSIIDSELDNGIQKRIAISSDGSIITDQLMS